MIEISKYPCPNLTPVGRSAQNFFGVWSLGSGFDIFGHILVVRGVGFDFLDWGLEKTFGQGKIFIARYLFCALARNYTSD